MTTPRLPSIIVTGLPVTHPAVPKLADPAVVDKMLKETAQEMHRAGYEDFAQLFLGPEDGVNKLVEMLELKHWHGIIIGAGVRKTDDLMPWMEQIIATVREVSPKTQIVFNTGPGPQHNMEAAKRIKMD